MMHDQTEKWCFPILYHASPKAGLTKLVPYASSHGEAYVYAIENPVTALLFGAPKDDFDLLMDEKNGVPELWECRPNVLREVYSGRSCSLYTVPEEGFLGGQTGWQPEHVCKTPVPIVHEKRVPDLYEWLAAAQERGIVIVHAFRADAAYHAFLLEEFRERIVSFGLTEKAVRADARLAPFWDELFPAENASAEKDAMQTEAADAADTGLWI